MAKKSSSSSGSGFSVEGRMVTASDELVKVRAKTLLNEDGVREANTEFVTTKARAAALGDAHVEVMGATTLAELDA